VIFRSSSDYEHWRELVAVLTERIAKLADQRKAAYDAAKSKLAATDSWNCAEELRLSMKHATEATRKAIGEHMRDARKEISGTIEAKTARVTAAQMANARAVLAAELAGLRQGQLEQPTGFPWT
jgi:uncharacterized protein YajQ (UPF0234 family)